VFADWDDCTILASANVDVGSAMQGFEPGLIVRDDGRLDMEHHG
jgi:hypothetical protein